MREGWHNDKYLILFDDAAESRARAQAYELEKSLPGFVLLGLCFWDDFIVMNDRPDHVDRGRVFTVPTVPPIERHLKPFAMPATGVTLTPDARFTGKVKWYIHPLIFGGHPTAKDNVTWIEIDQHPRIVCWWNEKYREISK